MKLQEIKKNGVFKQIVRSMRNKKEVMLIKVLWDLDVNGCNASWGFPYVAESTGESCCVVHKATGLCK